MTPEEKIWKIIERLRSLTIQGELTWERTASPTRFQAAFPQYVVRITEPWGEEGQNEPDYWFAIFDELGAVVETVNDTQLTERLQKAAGTVYKAMGDLYKLARRRALGVDAALDRLLELLPDEQPGTTPSPPKPIDDDDQPF